jgi:deoxyribodipyrimidine photo-lyase
MHERSLFLFRRDLRLTDNTGLRAASAASKAVIPAFVFDPRQCDPDRNAFFSPYGFAFLVQSLKELNARLRERGSRLYVFAGDPADVVTELVRAGDVSALYVNRDYTPFSRERDERLQTACTDQGAAFHAASDLLLSEPEAVQPAQGGAYHVFSRFRRHAQSHDVARPDRSASGPYYSGPISVGTVSISAYDRYPADELFVSGGRSEGETLLEAIPSLKGYRQRRHRPEAASYTGLSAHHKFGTVSIRESYWAVRDAFDGYHKLQSQLYWRDFYTHLVYHRPEQLTTPLRALGRYVGWINDPDVFRRWCDGQTGVPFIDAGMRQLNQSGYMHNRARMAVASFLTKDLLTDWRWGAQYFARTLIDYDPSVNAGNWQWAASVGTDYKLRIYNPYLQAKKHDKKAHYIKRWVPELRDVSTAVLTGGDQVDLSHQADYPAPVVDRHAAYHRARDAFGKARDHARAAGY